MSIKDWLSLLEYCENTLYGKNKTSHVTTGEGGSKQSGARFRSMDPTDNIKVMRFENSQDCLTLLLVWDDTKNKVRISEETSSAHLSYYIEVIAIAAFYVDICGTSSKASQHNAPDSPYAPALRLLQGHKEHLLGMNRGSIFVGKPLDEQDITNNSNTQSEASGTESEASGSETESSDSSNDVIILEHKPAEWIDRNPEDLRKRKREEEGDDDVILLDKKPANWVERKWRC
ncbi:hypothetical protein BDR06DRAFT_966987 [Suillus hirtellus]|nr:hypothetical protein BDR06DRAFT_966987 [Suillus hirtellus]